jgi:hypothetical protein
MQFLRRGPMNGCVPRQRRIAGKTNVLRKMWIGAGTVIRSAELTNDPLVGQCTDSAGLTFTPAAKREHPMHSDHAQPSGSAWGHHLLDQHLALCGPPNHRACKAIQVCAWTGHPTRRATRTAVEHARGRRDLGPAARAERPLGSISSFLGPRETGDLAAVSLC